MDEKLNYSEKLKVILCGAEKLAEIFKSSYIGSEHLVFAMLNLPECAAYKILSAQGISAKDFEDYFARSIDSSSTFKGFTPRSKIIIQEAEDIGKPVTRTDHLLLSIINSADCLAMRILRAMGTNMSKLANELLYSVNSGIEE